VTGAIGSASATATPTVDNIVTAVAVDGVRIL
jgi:hypothetical protein